MNKQKNGQGHSYPDNKVYGANMGGPTWGRQDPGGMLLSGSVPSNSTGMGQLTHLSQGEGLRYSKLTYKTKIYW